MNDIAELNYIQKATYDQRCSKQYNRVNRNCKQLTSLSVNERSEHFVNAEVWISSKTAFRSNISIILVTGDKAQVVQKSLIR